MFHIQNRPQGQPFLQKEGMKSSSGKFYAISVTHICHFTRHWIAVGNQIHGKLGKNCIFFIFGQFLDLILSRMTRVCNQKLLADFHKLQFLKSLDCIFKQSVILKGFVSVLLFKHILWHDSLLDIFWGVLKDCNESLSACQNNLLFVV